MKKKKKKHDRDEANVESVVDQICNGGIDGEGRSDKKRKKLQKLTGELIEKMTEIIVYQNHDDGKFSCCGFFLCGRKFFFSVELTQFLLCIFSTVFLWLFFYVYCVCVCFFCSVTILCYCFVLLFCVTVLCYFLCYFSCYYFVLLGLAILR